MRDKERIDRILKKIETIWKKNPDLRLFQLLLNYSQTKEFNMLYHVEDNILEDILDNYEN